MPSLECISTGDFSGPSLLQILLICPFLAIGFIYTLFYLTNVFHYAVKLPAMLEALLRKLCFPWWNMPGPHGAIMSFSCLFDDLSRLVAWTLSLVHSYNSFYLLTEGWYVGNALVWTILSTAAFLYGGDWYWSLLFTMWVTIWLFLTLAMTGVEHFLWGSVILMFILSYMSLWPLAVL